MAEFKREKLRKTKDGKIKDFSVPDAHTLMVTAFMKGEVLRKESVVIWSLDELDKLHNLLDPQDGMVLGEKWAVNKEVIRQLKSKGEAINDMHPVRFHYLLRKTKFASELRHRG